MISLIKDLGTFRFTILTNLRKQLYKFESRRTKPDQGDDLPPQNRVSNSYAAALKLKQVFFDVFLIFSLFHLNVMFILLITY